MADEILNNTAPPEEPLTRIEEYLDAIMQNTANYDTALIKKSKSITANGNYSALNEDFDGYEEVNVNVPNSYTLADEGKVVSNGSLVAQTSTAVNTNGTVDTTLINSVDVNVPNTYTQADEGKVVNNGALTAQTSTSTTQNGTLDTTLYNSVNVNVPNTYTAQDEGKVVNNGALTAQTSTNITQNGTVNTTLNNEVVVNVPNSYTAQDEGKVVDNGALVAQTAMSNTITANDTYDTTLYNSVTVNVPTGGSGAVEEKDVNFYDYDGTCVYAYTKDEFLALNEMPANPTHTGLTAQGWNWTYQEAQSFVQDNGVCDIGQMYITDDGSTRLYIELSPGAVDISIYLARQSTYGDATVVINWGDNNSETVTFTDNNGQYIGHSYNISGNYVISIKVTSGRIILGSSNQFYGLILPRYDVSTYAYRRTYWELLKGLEIGENIRVQWSSLDNPVFLDKFLFPNSNTTQIQNVIGNSAYHLSNTSSYIVPRNVQNISPTVFINVSENNHIIYHPLVSHCYNYSGTKLIIPNTTCTVAINTAYHQMRNIIIPEGRTSLPTISNSSAGIQNYEYYSSLTIPSTITSLSNFYCTNLPSLKFIKFKGSVPPTLADTNIFNGLRTDCKIYVPTGTLTDYTTASNYPDPTVYTYIEY